MARVLVIEDEDAVRAGVTRCLRFAGHEVLEASGGAPGIALAIREPLDLVITDINMPDGDGIEVILALSDAQPALPVIAMSGGGRTSKGLLLASAAGLGAVRTLSKPFELTELRDAVADVLGGAGRRGDES